VNDEKEKWRQAEDAQSSDCATNSLAVHRFGSDDERRLDLMSML
jgi:hypothetical protein